MNKIILLGRLTKDPETKMLSNGNNTVVSRYSLAVDKKQKRDDGVTADFFNMVAFGKNAEFTEKYFRKGMKVLAAGRVQTGSYEKNGMQVPFIEVVVEEQEFAENKSSGKESRNNYMGYPNMAEDYDFSGFHDELDELPFN